MTAENKYRFLIVNQHGENRGDEAALKGLAFSLLERYPDSTVTVLGQFRDRHFEIPFPSKYRRRIYIRNMLIPLRELIPLSLFLPSFFCRLPVYMILGKNSREIAALYENCTYVISAPGGPYFGDLYCGKLLLHELAHQLLLYWGTFLGKKTALFSPSAGPYRKKMFNMLRKKVLSLPEFISLRDEVSFRALSALTGRKDILLASDSAFLLLDKKELNIKKEKRENYTVSVAIGQHAKYNNLQYLDRVRILLSEIYKKRKSVFNFYPQLYGKFHSDVEFVCDFIESLPFKDHCFIKVFPQGVEELIESWSNADIGISTRYHPIIFSVMGEIPFIAFAYEHKQSAFCKTVGMAEYCFEIGNLNDEKLLTCWENIELNREEICKTLKKGKENSFNAATAAFNTLLKVLSK